MALGGGAASSDIDVQVGGDSSGLRSALGSGIDKLKSFRGAAAAASGALGLLAAKGIKDSIGAAADLDAAITESTAIMGDLSDKMRDDMSGAAREVARSTTFAAEEAGDAFYYLASAGLDAEQSIAAMPQVAEFAQAGMFDLETATDLATDAQSALGMKAEDAAENMDNLQEVTDTLVGANTLANASVEQFATSLTNKAAASMRQANMEMQEGVSVLAAFADQGLKGERAGTILARTIDGLQSSAQKNEEAFDQLGVSVYDSEGNMRSMADITQDLEGALAGMSTEQQNAAFNQLGLNKRAARGVKMMMGNSEAMREYEGELKNMAGITGEVAEKQLQSFHNQLELAKSVIRDIGIGIGQVFLPAMTGMLSTIVDVLTKFAEWNDEMDGLPGAIGLVSTAVGGLLGAMMLLGVSLTGTVLPALAGLTAALGVALTPIAAVTAAVGTMAYVWRTNFAGIRDATVDVMNLVDAEVGQSMTLVRDIFTEVSNSVRNVWTAMTFGVEDSTKRMVGTVNEYLITRIAQTFGKVQGHLGQFLAFWQDNSTAIEQRTINLVSRLRRVFGTVIDAMRPVVGFLVDTFKATWESAVGSVIDIGETLFDLVLDLGQRFGIFGEDVNTLSEVLGQLLDPFRKVELAVDGVDEAFSRLTEAWDEDWMGVQTTTQEATDRISTLLGGMEEDSNVTFASIQENVQTQFVGALTSMREETMDTSSTWTSEMTTMGSSMQETFGLLWQILDEILIPVTGVMTQVWQKHMGRMLELVRVHLGPLIAEFMETLTHLNENIVQPILEAILIVWDAFGDEIMTVLEFAFDYISLVVTNVLDVVLTTIRVFLAVLRGDWGDAWNLIAGLMERMLGRMIDFLGEWVGRYLDWVADLINGIIQWFKDLYHDLVGGSIIPEMLAAIMSAFEGFGESVFSWLKAFVRSFLDFYIGLGQDFKELIKRIVRVILGVFDTFGSDTLEWLGGMVGDFIDRVINFGDDVVQEFEDMGEDALDKITSLDFAQAGKDAVTSLADGIRSKIDKVSSAADSLADAYDKHMPGSDAETGPLSNLSEYGPTMVEMTAEGVTSNLRQLERAADDAAQAAHPDLRGDQLTPGALTPRARTQPREGDTYDIDVVIEGDADEDDVNRGLGKALKSYRVD